MIKCLLSSINNDEAYAQRIEVDTTPEAAAFQHGDVRHWKVPVTEESLAVRESEEEGGHRGH